MFGGFCPEKKELRTVSLENNDVNPNINNEKYPYVISIIAKQNQKTVGKNNDVSYVYSKGHCPTHCLEGGPSWG